MSLLRNGEHTVLKCCKYPCSFTYILVKDPTASMENEQKDVLQVVFCVVIFKTTLVHTKRHITLDTFEHHSSFQAPC